MPARKHPVPQAEASPTAPRRMSRFVPWLAGLFVLAIVSASIAWDWYSTVPDTVTATYVGRQTCIECHAGEGHKWTGSDHDLAMALASPESVVGDFSGVELTALGITSKMYRAGEKYMVRTEGPDGEMHDYQVKYTFGIRPLQQYLVEFDRPADMPENEISRCQVLPLTWDVKGKKWFHLTPTDVKEKVEPTDELHWTGVAYNWNNMCADCHSTNLQKNYNATTGVYHTTFSEMNVSCEACHGPGSVHVQLAKAPSLFWDRQRGYGLAHLKSADTHVEIETCATCHSRRHAIYPNFEGGKKFHDHFSHELLGENTYYPDGQILDEVYEYGSFIQSKMYANKIRCTDCHDPHTTKLKHDGNKVCTSCHQHPDYKYDVPAHHQHQPGGAGAQCVDCHMPGRYYMEVDFRRDHSLRVPRPDLSVTLGTPNACTGCHLAREQEAKSPGQPAPRYADCLAAAKNGDKAMQAEIDRLNRWAADKVEEWYGKHHTPDDHFAPSLAAAWRGEPTGEEGLLRWAGNKELSPMVRASLLAQLAQYGGSRIEPAKQLLADPDPLLRTAAIESLDFLTPRDRRAVIVPLLKDPVREVRVAAARQLLVIPPAELSSDERLLMRHVLLEFVDGVLVNNDRGGAHALLGDAYDELGDFVKAEKAYRTGIHVEPGAVGPRSNWAAALDRRSAQIDDSLARTAGQMNPQSVGDLAGEAHDLRAQAAKLRTDELKLLERQVRVAPHLWQVHYRYGGTLSSLGKFDEAEKALQKALELNPNAVPAVLEMMKLAYKQRRLDDAHKWAEKLVELRPQTEMYRIFKTEIEAARKAADKAPPAP